MNFMNFSCFIFCFLNCPNTANAYASHNAALSITFFHEENLQM